MAINPTAKTVLLCHLAAVCSLLSLTTEQPTAAPSTTGITHSPQNLTIPTGKNGTFVCISNSSIVWLTKGTGPILIYDMSSASSSPSSIRFFSHSGNGSNSTLTVPGIQSNNLTTVACATTAVEAIYLYKSSGALLRLYGPPTPLQGFQLSPETDGKIRLSWSPSFSSFSTLTSYEVKVEEQTSGSIVQTTQTNTTSILYMIPKKSCSALKFNVCAFNEAGSSNERILIYEALTEPNVTAIAESLKHTVYMRDGRITTDINFSPPEGCQANQPTDYFLILQNSAKTQEPPLHVGPSTEPKFSIGFPSINENARYNYKIEATIFNRSSQTSEHIFYTTDVQMPTARITANSVVVTCKFITGSRSRGCHIKITERNSILESCNVSRGTGVVSVEKKFTSHYPKELNIVVFDWEADGNLGSLGLYADIQIVRALSTEALSANDSHDTVTVIATAVGGVFLAAVSVILLVCCFCALYRKRRVKMGINNMDHYSKTYNHTVNDRASMDRYKTDTNDTEQHYSKTYNHKMDLHKTSMDLNTKDIEKIYNILDQQRHTSGAALAEGEENHVVYEECGNGEDLNTMDATEEALYDIPNFLNEPNKVCKEGSLNSANNPERQSSTLPHDQPEQHYSSIEQMPIYAVLESVTQCASSSSVQQEQANVVEHQSSVSPPVPTSAIPYPPVVVVPSESTQNLPHHSA